MESNSPGGGASRLTLEVVGLGGLLCSVTLPDSATVADAKVRIEEAIRVPAIEQRLLTSAGELQDDAIVAAAGTGRGQPHQHTIEVTLLRRDPEQAAWLHDISLGRRHLQDAPEHLRGDPEVVLAACSVDASSFRFAAQNLRADRELVLKSVSSNGLALRYAAEELRGDREVVIMAVKSKWNAIAYAAEELRADREVVLKAVSSWGNALAYAAEELRGDRELVLQAVSSHGMALAHASEELRGDREVVLAAISSDGDAIFLASQELQTEILASRQ